MRVRCSMPKSIWMVAMAGWMVTGCEKPAATTPSGGTSSSGASAGSGTTAAAPKASPAPAAAQSAEELKNLAAMVKGNETPPAGHTHPTSAPPPRVGGVLVPTAPDKPLTLTTPDGWTSKPPRNAMRRAEYVIPRSEGDTEDGEAALFYFGQGDGGDVQANLTRWKGMFTTSEGQPLPDSAVKTEKTTAGAFPVTIIELEGRYTPSAMGPAAPPAAPKNNQIMIGAVIETPDGSYFYRAVGPEKTMKAQRDACFAMVKSATK